MFGTLILNADAGEGARIVFSGGTVFGSDNGGSPWGQFAGIFFGSDGTLTAQRGPDGGSDNLPPGWVSGAPDAAYASDYEIMAQEVSQMGFATRVGSLNTWEDAASSPFWRVTRNSSGDASWQLQISIRHKVSQVVYGSGNVFLNAIDAFS